MSPGKKLLAQKIRVKLELLMTQTRVSQIQITNLHHLRPEQVGHVVRHVPRGVPAHIARWVALFYSGGIFSENSKKTLNNNST